MAPMDREIAIAKLKALGAGAALARKKLAGGNGKSPAKKARTSKGKRIRNKR
jgi:hypothetical protein